MSHAAVDSFTTFGELLKYLRRRMQMTQQQLGTALGYSAAMIARLENGERLPDFSLVKTAYVEALGLQREPAFAARLTELAAAAHRRAPAVPRGQPHPRRHNLPTPLTNLVGRQQDIADGLKLLGRAEVHLITLLGPPGVGKTRLAVEVVRQASADFADGVCFVPLAPLTDPGLVAAAMAQALDLGASQADPMVGVKLHLRDKHLLLALDNFEHLLDAAPVIAEVLAAAPRVKAIATSRAALHLSGEFVVDVQPLAAPSAVELFVARADAIQSGFALTSENHALVEEICRRVDGLPLAIELAAARLRLFSPRALLTRLAAAPDLTSHAVLDLLAAGQRDLPARQRTLRQAIAWSYDLLTPAERHLLRHLSVFAGGCSPAAAQAVAGHPATFDADLQALLDSSLIQRNDGPDGEPRFALLEMIREFAAEQLAACGEAEPARQRHATYCLGLVRKEGLVRKDGWPRHFESNTGFLAALGRLDLEYDNFRAALGWSLDEAHDATTGADLALELYWLWWFRRPWGEAAHWLGCALAQTEAMPPTPRRARLLTTLARFTSSSTSSFEAARMAREAFAIHKALEDSEDSGDIYFALQVLSDVMREVGSLAEARAYGEELLALARRGNDPWHTGWPLFHLGDVALSGKDIPRAAAYLAERLSQTPASPAVLNLQGTLACYEGAFDQATALCEKALADFREQQFPHGIAGGLHSLGDIALFQGDAGQARSRFTEGLRLFGENGNRQRAVWCLGGLAAACAVDEQAVVAVTLWSAAQAIHAAIGSPRPALRIDDYRARVDGARSQLDGRASANAEAAGRAMSFEQAVEYALATMSGSA